MSLADDLKPNKPTAHPKGWEPYAEQVGQIGSAVTMLPAPNATRRDLIVAAGFDPELWRIKGDVQVRRWMRFDQQWLYYYKYELTAGEETDEQRQLDVAALVKRIKSTKQVLSPTTAGALDGWAYVASDWQIGKSPTGDTVERVLASIAEAKAQVKELRRIGRKMPHGMLAGTGDLIEGTCGFYPSQPYETDLNRRDQLRTTRHLLTHAIDELSPLFDRFTVLTVGGNHGENREDGRARTGDADNDDVAVFEAVREAFDRTGSDIEWVIPDEELSLMYEIGGVEVAFTHGHLFRAGATVQAKAHKWWQGQDFGYQAIRGARVLVSSHFHHFSAVTYGARTHLQSPACDPGSPWFTKSAGEHAPSGVLTVRLDASEPLGWADLSILPCRVNVS